MFSEKKAYKLSLSLLVVLLISHATIVAITSAGYRDISQAWVSFSSGAQQKEKLLNSLRSNMGYGGFIHQFKNYILRREEHYRQSSVQHLKRALAAAAAYQKINPNEKELSALADLVAVLNQYQKMIEVARQDIEFGRRTSDIDVKVKVKDAPAINALNTLSQEVGKQVQDTQHSLDYFIARGQKLILVGLVTLILFAFIDTYLVSTVRYFSKNIRQRARYLDSVNRSLPCGLIVSSEDGTIEEANNEAQELFSKTLNELRETTVHYLLSSADSFEKFRDKCSENYGHFVVYPHSSGSENIHVLVRIDLLTENLKVKYIITVSDVTELESARLELADYNRQLRQKVEEVNAFGVLLNEHALVSETDVHGEITYANAKFSEVSGYPQEELIGQNHRVVNSNYHSGFFWNALWKDLVAGNVWQGEITNRRKDGSLYWVLSTIMPFRDENGRIYKYVSARTDITESKKAEARIHQLAYVDSLTNLPNMAGFKEALEKAMSDVELGPASRSLVVIGFSINDMKDINGTFGWSYGDSLIEGVAERVKMLDMNTEVIAKIGGDRFGVLSLCEDPETAVRSMLEKLASIFTAVFYLDAKPIRLRSSSGVVVYPDDLIGEGSFNDTAGELITYLELCRIEALKKPSADCVRFERSIVQNVSKRTNILQSIEKAVSDGEVYMVYQPQISLKDGSLVGVEALIRWQKNSGEFVSPGDFIPVLEVSEYINELSVWTTKECLRDLSIIQKVVSGCKIGINISANFLTSSVLIPTLDTYIKKYNIQSEHVELEVTESSIMNDLDDALDQLKEVKRKGFRVSVDDFGTGHSSLSYLAKFPVDQLKIDKSFVRYIESSFQSRSVIKTIIALGKSLNLEVIAEGTETKQQIDLLRRKGCDEAQGFYIAKPMKLEDLLLWCEKHSVFTL